MNHDRATKLLNIAWDEHSDSIIQDAKTIFEQGFYAALNIGMPYLQKAEEDYRGLATCASNNGLKATAKDALETADYIKQFLEGNL